MVYRKEWENDHSMEDALAAAMKNGQRIFVAVDSASDLPEEWVARYNLFVINNRIHTEEGMFSDREDIDSDGLLRYMAQSGKVCRTEPPSVAEFTAFFSTLASGAEHVLFVTLGKNASKSHAIATEAADAFRNVTVMDSGHLSTAAGLLAVYAAHLALSARDVETFLAQTERFRERIRCSMLTDTTEYMARGGAISPRVHGIMSAFLLHPVISAKDSAVKVKQILAGERKKVRERYIRGELNRKKGIDPSVLVIVYAGMQREELDGIRAMAEAQMHFDRIVYQKLSGAIAGHAGPGTFGFMYCIQDGAEAQGAFSFLAETETEENRHKA